MKSLRIVLLMLSLRFLSINAMNQVALEDQSELEFKLWCNLYSIQIFQSAPINQEKCRQEIEKILKNRVNPNCISFLQSSTGTVPLIFAISLLDGDLVKLLLDYGADINLVDPLIGITAIHKVLDYLESYLQRSESANIVTSFKILDLLLINGANLEVVNLSGDTASHRCQLLI